MDAWFDIVTTQSMPGPPANPAGSATADAGDVWISLGTALIGEIPLAVLQISGAIMLLRFLILAHPLHDPGLRPCLTSS